MVSAGDVLQHRYEVVRPLGRGASASTFLARDRLRDDLATIKVLHLRDADGLRAFQREFATLSGRFHPHLIHVRDFGSAPARAGRISFYAADHVPGDCLSTWASTHGYRDSLSPIADVLGALAFLHHLGIRHGDVKPDNVVVDDDGRGVLIDLGCAEQLRANADTVSGTPAFMAPELLRGERADARADLFSVGVMLRMLAGDALGDHARLVARLTHEDPDRRPIDVAEVLQALGFEAPGVGPPLGRHADILGRAAELRAFREAFLALLDRGPGRRALFLAGADGTGRTRLLNEMKWEAQLRSDVVEGWAHNDRAFSDMLARVLELPDLRRDVSGILDAHARLERLGNPVVLVLDDVHELSMEQQSLLRAWVHLLRPSDPCLMLLAGREAPQATSVQVISLGALDPPAVSAWCAGWMGPRAAGDVIRLTGGIPADVEALLARVASGSVREPDLRRAGAEVLAPSRRSLAKLPSPARAVLGWLALRSLSEGELHRRAATDTSSLIALHAAGWITRQSAAWQLTRAADGPAILAALDPSRVASMHRALADEAGAGEPATRAFHLVMAGDITAACAHVERSIDDIDRAPQAWRRVAVQLANEPLADNTALLACARILRSCGDADRATSVIARVLRGRQGPETRAACRTEAALCHIAAGKLARADRDLRRGLRDAPNDALRAALLDVRCRLQIQRGDYDGVVSDATAALALAPSEAIRARLEESMGVALSYLGRSVEARCGLERAERALPQNASPRDRVRLLSYQAIAAYRAGDLAEAVTGYRRAHDLADEHGLADHVASTAMNLGTALQQQGVWGQALTFYERGARVARAIGKDNTRRTLQLNLANLHAGMGNLERASEILTELRREANEGDIGYVGGSITALEAEVALARGDTTLACDRFATAREAFEAQGARREVHEMDLHLASIALADRDLERAAKALQGMSDDDSSLPSDLRARWGMRRAAWMSASGDAGHALGFAQSALAAARASMQTALEAEAETVLAELYAQAGAEQLSRDHRRAALRSWESIAVTLPEQLRAGFWLHPQRASLRDKKPEPAVARGSRRAQRDLVRILEINRRLSSSLSADDVLAYALDAAIELSEAERGFLLVKSQGARSRLEVAVARNLDRERIGRSHLKFSRSIAENVVRSGEPVSTTDALADDRFRSNASVHAMRLRSVVCVPVKAPEGVLGAIYLDHRFRKDQFDDDAIELLQSFADQVAIALRNARLHADLERRTIELQAEQERVQALLAGQAREIDRLAAEVRTRQEALEFRYDYSAIVGTSAPMRTLFGVLDRVTDADIDVLIQGESGTGKELVARALHFNGPRRGERFVSVNCAALPDALLESELFGAVRGAYTGADRDREGLIVAARGGTLFLDEVGEMSLSVQAKLLRVLQERRVRPLGSNREIEVDVRWVCATNRRLRELVERGRFREDFYYRIGVVEMMLPSLRERREDIPLLCSHLVERAAKAMHRAVLPLRPDALRLLMRHPLPGNVRQLDNVLRRALVMADGDAIGAADLDLSPPGRSARPESARDRATFEEMEAARIMATLEEQRWNVSSAARALGMPRNTLYRKLKKYRIPERGSPGTT